MNNWCQLRDYVDHSIKGITPKYVDESEILVLNQKCIRNNQIDFSLARFHDSTKRFAERKIVKVGDLLINSTGQGTAGRCAFVRDLPEDKIVITDSHILIIRINDITMAECFSYSLYHQESLIQTFMEGSTGQGELDKIILFNLEFRLPISENTRKETCKLLYNLEAKMGVNNKINHELESIAVLMYEYWFVQFDFSDENGRPYKSSGGKMVFNEQLKREIPEGWEVKTISDWIKNDKSGDWGRESRQGNYTQKVSCIRGADINGLNGNGEVKTPARFILEKNSHKLLEPNDLVVEISGGSPTQSTGRLTFITKETLERFDNPLICSNFCKALTLKDEKYLFNFVYQWNQLYENNVLFGWEGKTSGIKNLLFDNFTTNYYVPVPPEHLAEKFYELMSPIQAKKQKNLVEIKELENLRDWLLPMLMNGQVSVGEVEEMGMVAEPEENYIESK